MLIEAHEAQKALPKPVKDEILRAIDSICDIGEENQVPPRIMAAMLAMLVGQLAMAHVRGDFNDNEGIEDFIDFGHAALHVSVANARIFAGWTPPPTH